MRAPPELVLRELLAAALLSVRQTWPEVEVEVDAVAPFVRARLDPTVDLPTALRALHLADLVLAWGCSQGSPWALARLESLYLQPLARELERSSRSAPLAADALQHLRARLLVAEPGRPARLGDYAGRGPLAGWLRIAALRTLANLRRAQGPAAVPADSDLLLLPEVSPELRLLQARDRAILQTALQETFAALTVEERNLLRLHFVEGLGLDRLSRLFPVHRATAARWLAAARHKLREGVLQRIQATLRLDPAELQSWIGLVRSQLGVSVRALLDSEAGAESSVDRAAGEDPGR